jgi:hypothetical protein
MTTEYLSVGHDDPPRWPRIVLVALVALVAVAAGVSWWTGHVRQQANDSLGAAVSDANHRAKAGEAVVLSTLQYASPLIWSTMVGGDVRAELRAVVERSAEEVVLTLQQTRESAEGTFVLPWDHTQAQAKDAVLELVDEQLGRFEAIAADAASIGPVLAVPAPSDAAAVELLRASGAQEPIAR